MEDGNGETKGQKHIQKLTLKYYIFENGGRLAII